MSKDEFIQRAALESIKLFNPTFWDSGNKDYLHDNMVNAIYNFSNKLANKIYEGKDSSKSN